MDCLTGQLVHKCMGSCEGMERMKENKKMNHFMHLCKTCVTRGAGRKAELKQKAQTCRGLGSNCRGDKDTQGKWCIPCGEVTSLHMGL